MNVTSRRSRTTRRASSPASASVRLRCGDVAMSTSPATYTQVAFDPPRSHVHANGCGLEYRLAGVEGADWFWGIHDLLAAELSELGSQILLPIPVGPTPILPSDGKATANRGRAPRRAR